MYKNAWLKKGRKKKKERNDHIYGFQKSQMEEEEDYPKGINCGIWPFKEDQTIKDEQ